MPSVSTAEVGTATTLETGPGRDVHVGRRAGEQALSRGGERDDDGVGVARSSLDCTGPTWDTVPSTVPSTPSTSTEDDWPTLTDGTCELSSVAWTS